MKGLSSASNRDCCKSWSAATAGLADKDERDDDDDDAEEEELDPEDVVDEDEDTSKEGCRAETSAQMARSD